MRAAVDLAAHAPDGELRKKSSIAAATRVPEGFLSQVLGDLVRAGLLAAVAGRRGGYRLARPPERISLLDVVEAVEGPVVSQVCIMGEHGSGAAAATCVLHDA